MSISELHGNEREWLVTISEQDQIPKYSGFFGRYRGNKNPLFPEPVAGSTYLVNSKGHKCITENDWGQFRFQGETIGNSVWKINPFDYEEYISPAKFNEHLALWELGAFNEMAGALGAKRFKYIQDSCENIERILNSDVKGWRILGRGKNETQQSSSARTLLEGEFGPPRQPPFMPLRLKGWANRKALARSLEANRVEASQVKLRLMLELEALSKAEIDVAKHYRSYNIQIGGSIKREKKTKILFDIEFYESVVGEGFIDRVKRLFMRAIG